MKLWRVLQWILGAPLAALVLLYRYAISPLTPPACRYTLTCSAYALEALKVWGPFKGTWLATKRIASCHPWGGHGHDPVPQRPSGADHRK